MSSLKTGPECRKIGDMGALCFFFFKCTYAFHLIILRACLVVSRMSLLQVTFNNDQLARSLSKCFLLNGKWHIRQLNIRLPFLPCGLSSYDLFVLSISLGLKEMCVS
jgi:hypothetical protein